MTRNENKSSCENLAELLSAYIDGQTDESQSRTIEEHLESCNICSEKVNQYKTLGNLINAQKQKSPIDFSSTVLSNVERDQLLGGLENFAKPSANKWGKFTKRLAAAAMITLIAATTFILIHFSSSEKGNRNVPKRPVLRFANKQQDKPKEEKFIVEEDARSKHERIKSLVLRPSLKVKGAREKKRNGNSLKQTIPMQYIMKAETPFLMLAKEQMVELIEANNISFADRRSISEDINSNREFAYICRKHLDFSDSSIHSQIIVAAEPEKISKICNQIKQVFSEKVEEKTGNKRGNLADLSNYFRSRGIVPLTTTAASTQKPPQIIPVLFILKRIVHPPTTTQATQATQNSQPATTQANR